MPRIYFTTFLSATALLALLHTGCARKNYHQPDARLEAPAPLPAGADSLRRASAGRQYNRHGRLYEALVGQHYRRTWGAAVAMPVFEAARAVPGGLKPAKTGGGFNSTSLGLTAADGQAYVLRTVDKDPGRATPALLRGTFLVNVLRDNVSSTQPYAALVVPPLAAAVGVPHTAPRLFYTRADDPTFASDSLRTFRGQLAWLEEKFSGPSALVPEVGTATVVNSRVAFSEAFANPARGINQEALLRARLFDAFLGDWDRHTGQWNWALSPKASTPNQVYQPIPKDRDMVFYRLDDGVLGWLIGHVALRHWTTFKAQYPPVARLMASGRYLDDRALNGLSERQFRTAAAAMSRQLPDSTLAGAVRRLPPAAFALDAARTTAALQARRDALPQLAQDFYRLLARHVVVGGTAQAERFDIQRFPDSTVVRVFTRAGSAPKPFYQRTFYPGETATVQLQGLGADDVFSVTAAGPGASRPRLLLFGGAGEDTFSAKSAGRGIRYRPGAAPPKHAYDTLPED